MSDLPTIKSHSTSGARAESASPVGWLRNEIDRLFDDFGRPSRSLFAFGGQPALMPAIELSEDDKEYRLTAELPGLSESDVEINVGDGELTLSGEKKEQQEKREQGYLLSERRYGSFRRSIGLPSDVSPDRIAARFKDGVLTVTLPKDEQSPLRARKIAIAKE